MTKELTEEEILAYKAYQEMTPLEALENKMPPFYRQKIKEIRENKDNRPKKELMSMLEELEYEIYAFEDGIDCVKQQDGPCKNDPSGFLREIILPKVYELKKELGNEHH